MSTSAAHHLRRALGSVVVCLVAIAVVVLHLLPSSAGVSTSPATASASSAAVGPTSPSSTPPRLLPETPTAVAHAAEAPSTTTSSTTSTTAPPRPTTTTPPAPPPPAVPRPERIRGLVDYPFEQRAPGWQIRWAEPRARGVLGLTDHRTSQIIVFLHDDQSDEQLAFTLAHEMAHALDVLHLTHDERDDYRTLRGIPASLDWLWDWDGGASGDFAMPAGDFAESFAVATVDRTSGWQSRLGPPPTPAQQHGLLALLEPA